MSFADDVAAQTVRLRRYAMRLTRFRREDAEDLVQDTIVRALTREHLFEPGTDIRAWLFVIMHNIHASRVMRYKRRPVALSLDSMLEEPEIEPAQFAYALAREVVAAIEHLPSEMIEPVRRAACGEKYEEIAADGLPIGTVRSRLSRGRARLREVFA